VISIEWQSKPAERQQRAWQLVSLGLHIAAVCLLWVAGSVAPRAQGSAPTYALTMVYVPPKSTKMPAVVSQGESITIAPPGVAGANIDLAGVRLAIQDDPSFELLSVLSRYQGFLGFASKDGPQYVTHAFKAPDWKPFHTGSWVSIEGFFTVRIAEPERWPVVRSLQRRNHIPADARVYALFPPSFRATIDMAIREEAARRIRQGRVREALIASTGKSVAGFVVENVTVERLP